ncbi:MAG TPA: serine/threonine-protein kinase [Ktedonobacterales bacterium]|nr:serine/threonine-protein kinase [Ktedonobacterales bacterium]
MHRSDLIGMRVGQNHQYQILEEMGRGGAARVYRAQDHEQARYVAIKILPIESEDRQSFMQRFKREAEVIRTLNHPNIVQVYDAGETDEFVYLVLRLLEGGTLRQRIAKERLSPQEVCQYMIQIALALSHAHHLGIIHRDVKPSNMLLDTDEPGHILLTDFGTAKILNAAGLTKTGATLGTPEYMSPEQAEGREVDPRSDIYSLGCSLYEALSGRPPFVGNTPISVLFQQVHSQATNIRAYNYDVPPQLWSVLRKCLAKRADERYGTAEWLAEELRPFAEGLIQPTPPPWRTRPTRRLTMDGLSDTPSMPSRPWRETNRPLSAAPPLTPPGLEGLGVSGALGAPGSNAQGAGLGAGSGAGPGIGPIPLILEGERAPNSRPTLGPRGPKPTVRLPASREGGTGLLSTSGPVRADERQAVSDFAAQLEAEEYGTRAAPSGPVSGPASGPAGSWQTQRPASPDIPMADAFPTMPTPITPPIAPTRAPNSQPYQGAVSGPLHERTNGPRRASTSMPLDGQMDGPSWDDWDDADHMGYRAPPSGASSGQGRSVSVPLDVDTIRAGVDPKTLGRRPPRRRPPALVGAAALALLLVVGVGLGMGGIKLFAKQGASDQPTPHPSATIARATATATIARPTATTTPNAQALLNQQAASAFRAITLAPFSDGACSSAHMTTRFSGTLVFVNLCMAKSSIPGPITVQVRQNGAVIRTLISNLRASSGASYSQGHTLPAGSYDMYVTMQINGKKAVADDIAFTVG